MGAGETTFYWYPMGTGNLETITLPFVTDLSDEDPVVEAATGNTIAGGMFRQLYGDWRRIVLLRQHLRESDATEAEALRGLVSLQSHLLAGYSIGVAVGENLAFGSFTTSGYARGTTTIGIPANAYAAWDASATLTAGDEVMLQSASPDGAREVHKLDTVTAIGSTFALILSRGLRYDHTSSILVRRRRFYPHLKLPEDQLDTPLLSSSNQGKTWDLRMELREDMDELWTFGDSEEQMAGPAGPEALTPFQLQGMRGRRGGF